MITLSIIIPVYNERDTFLTIVQRVQQLPVEKEIIVIDDCSTDGTRELVQDLEGDNLRIILQPRNLRKGNSVKKGIQAAQGEYVVIQDADLEYDPEDLMALLEVAQQSGVAAVLGSRLLGAQQRGEALPSSIFSWGRDALTLLYRLLYRSHLTDIATCYKMAPTALLQSLELRCDGFDLDFELVAKLTKMAQRHRLRVVEVPISYKPRTVSEGKKLRWTDGLTALWALIKYRFVD